MERNENDIFDELVRGKLSNYTEPPEPEWIRSIQAKKSRAVSLYQLYRLMLIGIIVGAGIFAGILLTPSQVLEQAGLAPSSLHPAEVAPTTVVTPEFASAVSTLQQSSSTDSSIAEGNFNEAPQRQNESSEQVAVPQNNRTKSGSIDHPKQTISPSKKASTMMLPTNETPPSEEIKTVDTALKQTASKEKNESEKQTEEPSDNNKLQSNKEIPCKADFDFYTSYSGEFNFVHLSPIADHATVSWDFGDGNGSDQLNAAHIFSRSAKYEVSLTVTDTKNTCSQSKTIVYQDPNEKTTPIVLSGQVMAGSSILKNAIVEVFAYNETKGRFKSVQTVRTNQLGEYNITLQRNTRYLLRGYPTPDADKYLATYWGNTVASEDASEIVVMPSEQDKLVGYTVQLLLDENSQEVIPENNPIVGTGNNTPQQIFLVDGNNNIVSVGSIDANGNYNFGNDVPAGNYNIVDPSTGASTPTTVAAGAKVSTIGKGSAGTAASAPAPSAASKVTVFPNPASSIVNFEINSNKEETAIVVIMDAGGVERSRQTILFSAGLNQSQYDLTSFAPGIYYIMIFRNNQQVSSSRIVKLADTSK
jgi:PKD repeat protein